jgi:transposase InsO family protein
LAAGEPELVRRARQIVGGGIISIVGSDDVRRRLIVVTSWLDQSDADRRLRILVVVDDCTRECLALIADTSISGIRVARELDRLLSERGKRNTIVSDNGTELIRARGRPRRRDARSRRSTAPRPWPAAAPAA